MALLDPVTYALISQALIAIGREMGAKLVRSAYSSIIRESRDASAALLDRHGHVVAQAELIPMHLSAMAETFAPCAARYPIESLREGDFYITNDPYHGGQHLPDVYIFSPTSSRRSSSRARWSASPAPRRTTWTSAVARRG